MKSELGAEITESSRLGQMFDDVLAEVIDLRKTLVERDEILNPLLKNFVRYLGRLSAAQLRIFMLALICRRVKLFMQVPLGLCSIPIVPMKALHFSSRRMLRQTMVMVTVRANTLLIPRLTSMSAYYS